MNRRCARDAPALRALCHGAAALALVLGLGAAAERVRADGPAPGPATARALRVEYWTIEPNEGQSAGGHSAIRIGAHVHHVEHRGDGLIEDRRDPRAAFEATYRGRGNRGIDVLTLDLPPAVALALERELHARQLARRLRLDRLEAIDEDLRWLDATLETGAASVSIPGLGLLASGTRGCEAADEEPLARRRRERTARLGRARLGEALEAARAQRRRALREAIRPESAPALRGLVESAQLVTALEAILACRDVAEHALRPLADGGTHPVRATSRTKSALLAPPAEAPAWNGIARSLEAALDRLVESRRPDRGLALLLAWGRLAALDRTLESGTPYVLDAFREGRDARKRPPRTPTEGVWHARLLEAAGERERAALRALLGRRGERPPVEVLLDRLERARHDRAHLRAQTVHHAERPRGALVVSRALERPLARVPLPWPTGVTLGDLAARRAALASERVGLRRSLERSLGYSLFTRNCTTELLDALDRASATAPATADFAARRRRDPEAALAFIPVSAGRIVARTLPLRGRTRLPSARELALAELRPSALARLREANTLTSRAHRLHRSDSPFLFFTTRPIWLRPFAGVANLAVGLGASAAGLVSAPFDGGEGLRRGANGVLMSVPELFFFNVRKGSYERVALGPRRGAD